VAAQKDEGDETRNECESVNRTRFLVLLSDLIGIVATSSGVKDKMDI